MTASNALMDELLATDDGSRVKNMLFNRCIAGESLSHELQIEGSQGPRWIMLNARPLRGQNGKIQGALALATEISALKGLQRELELHLGSEAEGRLAGGIAHDMNNVLAVINGACDLMSRQLDAAPAGARQALEAMRRPAAEATAVLKQLLAFRKEPEAPPAAQASGGRERILLVDDEPEVRSVTARMLRLHGYEVLEAGSAGEAIAMHGLSGADLLLTDIIMPGTSGIVLAQTLRGMDSRLAVLFSSGYAGDELPGGADRLPRSSFIAKPFGTSELNQRVREALMLARQAGP